MLNFLDEQCDYYRASPSGAALITILHTCWPWPKEDPVDFRVKKLKANLEEFEFVAHRIFVPFGQL